MTRARGFRENVSFVDDVSAAGTVRRIHIEGDTVTVQRTYDAAPHLEHARQMRDAQDGQRWGEGKFIGHIPAAELARFLTISDPQERQRAMLAWLRENTAYVGFSRFLKR